MLPKRVFTEGERKVRGYRLPDQLIEELNKIALELGWNLTDVIQTVLDKFVQDYKEKK